MSRAVLVLMMALLVVGERELEEEVEGKMTMTRLMYDTMSQLVGEPVYPDTWWEERERCLSSISPRLTDSLERAWLGMIQYWEMGGAEGDQWRPCEQQGKWFESNCTHQPGLGRLTVDS